MSAKVQSSYKVWAGIFSAALALFIGLCFLALRLYDNWLYEELMLGYIPGSIPELEDKELYENIKENLVLLNEAQSKNVKFSTLGVPLPAPRKLFFDLGFDGLYMNNVKYEELELSTVVYLEKLTNHSFGTDHKAWVEWLSQYTYDHNALKKAVENSHVKKWIRELRSKAYIKASDPVFFEQVIEEVRKFKLQKGKVKRLKLDDLNDPKSLRLINQNEKSGKYQDGDVWVELTEQGKLKIVILTSNLGHFGSYGFAYSEVPLVPEKFGDYWYRIDVPSFLNITALDMQIDEHWWKVIYNLN